MRYGLLFTCLFLAATSAIAGVLTLPEAIDSAGGSIGVAIVIAAIIRGILNE